VHYIDRVGYTVTFIAVCSTCSMG